VSETLTLFEHETRLFDLTARQLAQLDQLQQQLPQQVLQPVYRGGGWASGATFIHGG
jgi:hypothetical protein